MNLVGRTSLVLLALLVVGCSDPRERELEEATNAMADLAVQCRKDTEIVPAQHSQHCIEAAKLVHPENHAKDLATVLVSHCSQNESEACQFYVRRLFGYRAVYWRAIAQSVDNFGAPVQSDGRSAGTGIYEFAQEMEPYFAQCLEQNPDPPKPPMTTAEPPPSDKAPVPNMSLTAPENRHCIALGTNKPPMLE